MLTHQMILHSRIGHQTTHHCLISVLFKIRW